MRFTWEQAAAFRMQRGALAQRAAPDEALDVVARIGGLHAQVMSSAELSLWARVEDVERDAVARMLWEDRSLVKTWAMRGTLHLLPAAELPIWLGALASYRASLKPSWFKAFEITPEDLRLLVTTVSDLLRDRLLTRQELAEEVQRATGSEALAETVRGSWGPYLKRVAFEGGLCFAPNAGRNVRFTHVETWTGPVEPLAEDAALDAVFRRVLAAYGPATRDDLARWWAMTPAAAGQRLKALEGAVEVDLEGEPAWMLEADLMALEAATAGGAVRLIPAFDPYVIGVTKHSERLMPGDFKARVHREAGWVSPVLLVDGRIEGVWRHDVKTRRVEVTIEPFRRQPAAVRTAAAEEAERLAGWLDRGLELAWE